MDQSNLPPAPARLTAGQWKEGAIPPKRHGKAAVQIVQSVDKLT